MMGLDVGLDLRRDNEFYRLIQVVFSAKKMTFPNWARGLLFLLALWLGRRQAFER